jgi:hypothetical protein
MDKTTIKNNIITLLNSDQLNFEEVDLLWNKFKDCIFAEKSIIHRATVIDMWRDNVSTNIRDVLIKAKNDIVCIYVDDTGRYMIFDDVEKYTIFLNACYLFLDEKTQMPLPPTETKKLMHYQIVLTDKKQKLVFSYHKALDDTLSNKIKMQIKECLGADSTIIYNAQWNSHQITVNMIIDNFHANDKYYQQLCKYVHSKGEIYHENIGIPPVKNDYDLDVSYILASIFQDDPRQSHIFGNLFTIVSINSSNLDAIQNNVYTNDDLAHTTKWIANNLPNDREKTMCYYERYTQTMFAQKMKPQRINIISNIVKAHGYGKIRPQNEHVWVLLRGNTQIHLLEQNPDSYEYIYFMIETPYNNKVKIGKTKDTEKRLKVLQTGNPNKLYVYHKIHVPVSINYESTLHKQYATRRILGGEWFNFTIEELNNEIKNLNDHNCA